MRRSIFTSTIRFFFAGVLFLGTCIGANAADIKILGLESTPFFPKAAAGESIRQLAHLKLENSGAASEAKVKITVAGLPAYEESLGQVPTGASTKEIHVPDIERPAEISIELIVQGAEQPADAKKIQWQPQRKWKIFCVSYSHHDLGFGNYPHRLRTDIRHANIERPLQFCRETDTWDEDSRFRFVIETSEPITSFLATHSEADAEELARRIREGRIQIGAIHTTVNTEQLGHELMARLFYLTNRHTRDLLNVPPAKTAQIDDVVGLTWPLATFSKEANVPYFFHGHNVWGYSFIPASAEAVFAWQGPGGNAANKVLVHSRSYGTNWDSINEANEAAIEKIVEYAKKIDWPYDAIISQDGTDFQLVTLDNANKIHNWNAKWAYPRLICSTMDMFFDAIVKQADPAKIKTFAKDDNNQWADQDSAAARVLAEARKQGEAIPTAEKFATIASALSGGEYPWTDIYQAYHRLLLYHEHTDGPDNAYDPSTENTQRVETEQAELREMADDAKYFADRARGKALDRLAASIATTGERTVVVFNPLNHLRTDIVRMAAADLGPDIELLDAATKKSVRVQHDGDNYCFVAADVPSLGYKTYRIEPASKTVEKPSETLLIAQNGALENRFYRIQFDSTTGAITSIFDKELKVELVDGEAPHRFNEYLYERFESPDYKVPSRWYRVEKATIAGSAGPVFARMTVKSSAVGAEKIVQSVVIYNDLKRIDFVLDLDKSPSGRDHRARPEDVRNKESVYVALPLKIPDFRFHHDLPGCVKEPVEDLFQGACTAYFAVRHFSDVSNSKYGVTVSAPESSLVEYGRPRSCPNPLTRINVFGDKANYYEMDTTPPANSHMYLYLMNNMFDCNIPLSQEGPARFTWSMRSHEGDWREGGADRFGWEVQNPLMAKFVSGKHDGILPAAGSSFLAVDQPNVVCTTIKPAEANGGGIVLRFVETQGKPTTATFEARFFGPIAQVVETNLIEEDREDLKIDGGKVRIELGAFGVKTIRLTSKPSLLPKIEKFTAKSLSDREIALSWDASGLKPNHFGYFRVYRGTKPDFKPGLFNLVARTAETSIVDRPTLNFGGWIDNRIEPETKYYYRVAAVDRWNNEYPACAAVETTTLKSSEKDAPPNRVERLSAVFIRPFGSREYVNLLFRTSCESDVVRYEVHRSTQSGFSPDDKTRIGEVDANAMIPGSTAYGHTPIDRRRGEFDHQMYQDETIEAGTDYYYRACAVDAAGQRGTYSDEASFKAKNAE